MKRIININLSGRVIPIEDSAYESLQQYIESLRRYFAAEEGRDEIINDIESRVAELMNDRVRRGAAAITDADMEEIISSMGRVEDFAEVDAAGEPVGATGAEQPSSGTHTGRRFKGRLYRDRSDKFLGGVCSGIANYMNVDPAIVRLLFAIITFGGFGFGIFLYILAWIILPARDLEGYVGKRLFRNPDDRMIGGVAGGLAAYFNKETWIVRLIFAAPILINILLSVFNGFFHAFNHAYGPDIFFGSFSGTFILAYIILWIVLPEARSPFEKMEMRGEKVDVNRIWQNVQEGMSNIGTRAQSFGEEVKDTASQWGTRAKEFSQTRGRTFAAEVSQTARPVATGIGHAIGVLFKAFFLFIAGTIAFALFVALLVLTLGGISTPFKEFLLNGFWQQASAWGVMILFLAVPLVAFITWMVRRLMKVRSQNRYLGWTFAGLWLLGFICLGIFIASMTRDFRYYSKVSQDVPVTQPIRNKMIVAVSEPEIQYSGTFDWINTDGRGWDLTNDSLKIASVKIRVEKSEDSNYHVTIYKYSAGQNRSDASTRAQRIVYSASTADSLLNLGNGYGIGKDQKFRGQKVMVAIKVPVGKRLRFDESVDEKLQNTDIRIRETGFRRYGRGRDMDWYDDNYFSDWKPNVDYVMTASGELQEEGTTTTTTTTPDAPGTYEYKGGNKSALDSQIEEQRHRIEEENRKLEELQKNRNNQSTTKVEIDDQKGMEAEELLLQVPSPLFSLII